MTELERHLRDSSAMLNAAIRIVRFLDVETYKDSVELWSEQVKKNMALLCGGGR